MKYLSMGDFAGVISDEIGGGNGLQPMILAAEMDKVVLDADLMGRAYPNVSACALPSEHMHNIFADVSKPSWRLQH